jgi:branched-chain amino acid transport system permease protein
MTPRALLRYWPALVLILFLALPFVPSNEVGKYARQFTPIFIFALLGLGLHVILGYTGVLHFGLAAFFGIGAYATGILAVREFPFQFSFPVLVAVSVVAAVGLGVATTAPALRLRGDYLALVTMAFGLIAVFVLRNLDSITGGAKGLNPISPPLLPWVDDPDVTRVRLHPTWGRTWRAYPHFYFLCLAVLAVTYLALGAVERSRLGRSWVALREDELAASCMGLNPARLKLAAIALGAGLAGLAGGLYAVSQNTTADPGAYDFNRSILVLCCVILGGLGNRAGVLLGVFLLVGFDQVLSPVLDNWVQKPETQAGFPAFMQGKDYTKLSMWRLGIFGGVLILMMRFRPEGLLPEARRKHELHPEAAEAAGVAAARAEAQESGDRSQESERKEPPG